MLEAGPPARLEVAGFPAAAPTNAKDGTPLLVTERQVSRAEGGVKSLDIMFAGESR